MHMFLMISRENVVHAKVGPGIGFRVGVKVALILPSVTKPLLSRSMAVKMSYKA